VRRGNHAVVRKLGDLSLPPSTNINFVIEKCIHSGKLLLIESIVTDFNALINKSYQFALLSQCIKYGQADILKYFLKCGANVNLCSPQRGTLLMESASRGYTPFVSILLGNKANINSINQNGETALICAIKNTKYDVATQLLNAGADITLMPHCGTDVIETCKNNPEIPERNAILQRMEKMKADGKKTDLLILKGEPKDKSKVMVRAKSGSIVCVNCDGKTIEIPKNSIPVIDLYWANDDKTEKTYYIEDLKGDVFLDKLVNGRWMIEKYYLTQRCHIKVPSNTKPVCHVVPAGLIDIDHEAIVRFAGYEYADI
jgi:hypothetical protein